jgi:hypothetical protein
LRVNRDVRRIVLVEAENLEFNLTAPHPRGFHSPEGVMGQSDQLIFSESPKIEISSNTFENVPTIIQFHDTPIIEVIKEHNAGYTTQISIYHKDGTYLAKVKGSQMYATKD